MSTDEKRPTVGQIVLYALSAHDVQHINEQRVRAATVTSLNSLRREKAPIVGSTPAIAERFPMIVTRAWGADMVSGQVFLDGPDTFWVRAASEGGDQSQWTRP